MNAEDLEKSKNPDLRASFTALRRAAASARQMAIQTNTPLVVVRDGEVVRIPPEQLRGQTTNESAA